MKQRFSSIDVKVIAHELQESLTTLRLSNAYDLSSRILLFKFAKPNDKKQLVIDTGFRCHLTGFARTTAAAPSVFVAKLRKSLKTRRLTSVSQVGTDRILEFQFSDGQYRLFLEFFASGNIILTDHDLNILALSRNVSEGEGQEPQRVGLKYSLENRQNYGGIPPLTKDRVRNALQAAVDKAAANAASASKSKGKPDGDLRKSLAVSITEIPPVLVDHVLHQRDFNTAQRPAQILENEALLDELLKSLVEARKIVDEITTTSECKGYIFAKRRPGAADQASSDETSPRENLLYDDFHPFLPTKLKSDPSISVLEFSGYNKTVDEFFSSLEGQKLESRVTEREVAAQRKLDAAKQDQAKRIEGLQEVQTLNMRKAAAIEANVERVQEAIDAVNGLVSQGMDWVDIGKLIEREKKRHNAVAQIIRLPLKLSENLVTLSLAEEEFGPEEEEDDSYETDSDASNDGNEHDSSPPMGDGKALNVEINLTISPWSNAREYYEQRRTAAVKEEKTQAQASRALKNTEEKIREDLKKGLKQEKALLQPVRKLMWFEKFWWFISSDGYLVVGGKDAQQNEMLYKKYLRKGDVYCHADLQGASTVVVKNNPTTPDAPIPPSTLTQAGNLSVCSSSAWDSKAGMGAWWVNAEQVSKSAPSGEFLPTGSFMIRGKKNFLPPAQLLLGLGIAFKISDESKARHIKHRIHDGEMPATPIQADSNQSNADEEVNAEDLDHTDVEDEDEDIDEGQDDEGPRDNPLQRTRLDNNGNDGDEDDSDNAEDNTVDDDLSNLQISNDAREPDQTNVKDTTEDQDHDEDEDEEGLEKRTLALASPTATTAPSGASEPNAAKQNQPKRGQRGKAKKIANKYKYQDEEDRAAAEALIGAKAGQQRAEAEAKAKADREAELVAAKERRRAEHQKQQRDIAEHEEIRKVMMSEGLEMLDPDEAETMTPLDALVGTPLAGDEIIEAVPVCAPWQALGKYKYKVKMQPGATKKGKAVKEVMERWKAVMAKKGVIDEQAQDREKMWPREAELIKALKPEEIVNIVPVGKLRVMVAGGATGGSGGGGGGNAKKGGAKGGRGGKGGKGSKR